MDPIDDERRRLVEVVRSAGPLALSWFRHVSPRVKEDGSPVTEADVAVERLLVERLADAFPDDAIVSEEGSRRDGRSGSTWYLDPIDGTGAFVQGLAHWGPTCCRRRPDGRFDLGAFHLPLLGETFSAASGGGAWRDEQRLPRAPDDAVGRSDFLFVPSRVHRHPGLRWPGKIRALGSTAAHLALTAGGAARAAIIPSWSWWDVGCGAVMAEEVGMVVCGVGGQPVDLAVCSEGLPLVVGAPNAVEILVSRGERG